MGGQAAQAYSAWDCPLERICIYENAGGTRGRIILVASKAATYNLKYYNFDGTQTNVNDKASSVRVNAMSAVCYSFAQHENDGGDSFTIAFYGQQNVPNNLNDQLSSVTAFWCNK